MPTPQRLCGWVCGETNQSRDIKDPLVFMRWSRLSDYCWYCARVWKTELEHKYPSRQVGKDTMMKDMAQLNNMQDRVKLYKDGVLSGRQRKVHTRTGGVEKCSLETSQSERLELVDEGDDFYTVSDYE